MPHSAAIAAAVRALSPVSITTRTPLARRRDHRLTRARAGVGQPPENPNQRSTLAHGHNRPGTLGEALADAPGNAEQFRDEGRRAQRHLLAVQGPDDAPARHRLQPLGASAATPRSRAPLPPPWRSDGHYHVRARRRAPASGPRRRPRRERSRREPDAPLVSVPVLSTASTLILSRTLRAPRRFGPGCPRLRPARCRP